MLIKALCDYYDMLAENGKVSEKGFANVPVKYKVILSPEGEIREILDISEVTVIKDSKGKEKSVKKDTEIRLPFREKSTSEKAYLLDHRGKYIFGLAYDSKTGELTAASVSANTKFRELNLQFIEGMDSPAVNAFRAFLEKWEPEKETESPVMKALGKAVSEPGFCFSTEGQKSDVHTDELIIEKIRLDAARTDEDEYTDICAVTGKKGRTAEIHNSVKGILGQKAGTFVCVKGSAGESYGMEKAYTSNISEETMNKYTEAFNILTSEVDSTTQKPKHKAYIDSMTVVFFAVDRMSDKEDEMLRWLAFDDGLKADEANSTLVKLMDCIRKGESCDYDALQLNKDTEYVVAGFVPNSSRVSMKFLYHDSFGKIMDNIMMHQQDISLENMKRAVTVRDMMKELVSPVSSNAEVPPPLVSAVFDSIFYGRAYPAALLETVVRRVKTDSDTDESSYRKLNPVRAGIIKAYLNRKARISNNKEEIKMALDTTNTDPAYLCGRLFAMLEKIQRKALGDVNSSIKDSYFAAACSKPATVFPRLMMLSQAHLSKLDNNGFGYNKVLGEITALMGNEFPNTLSLEDQGRFILGYYQQSFAKKEDK